MAQVCGWMTCGLLLTAFVLVCSQHACDPLNFIFSSQITFFGLIIAQLALVFVISRHGHRLSGAVATSLFMPVLGADRLTLSSIFIAYTYSSIASTFVVTAGMFGAMSLLWLHHQARSERLRQHAVHGADRHRAGLAGEHLAESTALMWAITYIGVVVFVGLTAYDTQKLGDGRATERR
ncbi:Bax inhibitor-1 family protein [Serratia ureilytica]